MSLLSIVAPVFNEGENIAAFIRDVEANIHEPHEILIVYDFPEDNTLPAIQAMQPPAQNVRLVHNTIGRGVLNAIKAGFQASKGDVVAFMSADRADEPASLVKMAALIRNGADVAAGSRYMKGGQQIGKKIFKQFLSRFAGLSLHYLAGLPIHDATNNFRAYSRRVTNLPIESTMSFAIGIELVLKAHWNGWRIEEVPTTWRDRTAGTSQFKIMKWMPEYLKWYLLGFRHAWFRRSLFGKALCMALVNGLLLGWALFPLLFGDRIVSHTDATLFSYPFLALFGDRIGESGLMWNDLSGAGFPSLFVHGFLFQPFLWMLLAAASPVDALHYSMFLYAWLGSSLLAFAILRMGYHPLSAWLGSIAFPFVLWGWLFEPTISFFLPLFGAAVLAMSAASTRPRTSAWCTGAVIALAFLSLQSHYAVLLLAAVCLLWIIRRSGLGLPITRWTRADGAFGLAIITGLFVGTLRVLPLVAYALLSTRKGEFLDAYLGTYTIGSGYFLRYLFASTSLPVDESYFANTPFLGIGLALLVLLGVLLGRKRPLVYAGLGVIAVSISLALPSSVTFQALRVLPGVSQLGDPARYLLLAQLALLALAVEGFEVVRRAPESRMVRTFSRSVIVLSIVLIAIGAVLAAARVQFGFLSLLTLRNPETAFLLIGGLLLGILLTVLRIKRIRLYSEMLIALLAAGLLLQGYSRTYAGGPSRIVFDNIPESTVLLAETGAVVFPFLTSQGFRNSLPPSQIIEIEFSGAGVPQQKRIMTMLELRHFAAQALGAPNTHLLHGLSNILMFDHIKPERLDSLLSALDAEYGDAVGASGTAPPIQQLQSQLLKHWHVLERLGVTHVLTPIRLPGRTAIATSLLLPEILAPGETSTGSLVALQEEVSLYIYGVPRARPHVSAAGRAITVKPDKDAARSRVLAAAANETVIECIECPATSPGEATLTLLERTPVRTHARVQSETAQWIVLQRTLLPGWRIEVDGKQVQPGIADSVFIAVPVPAGDHSLTARLSFVGMFEDAIRLLLSPKRTPWFSSNAGQAAPAFDPERALRWHSG